MRWFNPNRPNDQAIRHYKIRFKDNKNKCYVSAKQTFSTVDDLLNFYKGQLRNVIHNNASVTLMNPLILPGKTRRSPQSRATHDHMHRSRDATVLGHGGLCCRLVGPCPKVPKAVPFKELEIDKKSIVLSDKLGSGHFGDVLKGTVPRLSSITTSAVVSSTAATIAAFS